VVSDLDGKLLDSFTLRKPKGWGEKFMAGRPGRGSGPNAAAAVDAARQAGGNEGVRRAEGGAWGWWQGLGPLAAVGTAEERR
jgi:hypothetical protein